MSKDRSTSFIVRNFINRHPAIRECLVQGFVNYSALARHICKKERLRGFEGVVVACRRYLKRAQGVPQSRKIVEEMLANAHTSVVNKIAVAVVEKPFDQKRLADLKIYVRNLKGEFNLIEGRDVMTIIHSDRFSQMIKSALGSKVKRLITGLAQITLVFDERFETTPGVVAFIYGLLALDNLNLREEMSCGTDLLLVLSEADVKRALDCLSILE